MTKIISLDGKIWFEMCDMLVICPGPCLERSWNIQVFSFMIKSFSIGEVLEVKSRKITRQK
jgi:hypothetical protein